MNSSPSLTPAAISDKSPPSDLPRLLVLSPVPDAFSSPLSAKFTIVSPSSPLAASTEAVLVLGALNPVHPAFLDQYPSLKCVVTTSAGVNHIDMEACAQRGILVANGGEAFSKEVADYAVGLLIDVMRRITMSDRYVRDGSWVTHGDYPLGSKVIKFFWCNALIV
ncbi:hypothetical protein LUZ61_009881 [Rhynchospora tenuis]|uniref:D-isomer specific 2-hydroxyacid dehydrogenase catalytic domain-containing protein n=1 Tax=Rhynchospora tenuis TaxID=198213 RepID=A0AAD5ZY23_9POAL|nr:hypothetical protein LUZ61_009881 [Rhynchospora tenuis]